MRKPVLSAIALLGASSAVAHAIGLSTQFNCASDYYAYCSQFSPGSAEVRKCMRANGPKLSKACIGALIADGEVSKEDVARQKEKLMAAKAKPAEAKKAATVALKNAEPQAKKAAKLVAAPQRPKAQPEKPVIARAIEPAAPPAPVATPALDAASPSLTIDEGMVAALKSRGDMFLGGGEPDLDGTAEAVPRQIEQPNVVIATKQPETPAEQRPAAAEVAEQAPPTAAPDEVTAPAGSASVASPSDVASVADAGDDANNDVNKGPRAAAYPPGRMSLGLKLPSAAEPDQPTSWWEQLLRTLTGND